MNPAPFSQVVQWPGTVVQSHEHDDFIAFIDEQFNGTRAQFIGCFKTLPSRHENGVIEEGTGGRIDAYFAVHEDDIGKFAVARLAFGMRWVDDAIANEGSYSIYPPEVHQLGSWLNVEAGCEDSLTE